ncbi:MAG: LysR family transcriptional regulator [Amylibacter sp.]|jgi:DNA-binding transcriptional LysR family regulator|nr:LysR family transcriptional regulator [Amylibacter sp.]
MSKWNEVSIPRRFLPPFSWLASFEAVARCGSVTTAANELNLTQGAVSRHVQKLEKQIGVQLFGRDKQRLHLTGAGKSYAEEVRQGISLITNAGINLHTNPNGGALILAVLPAFGTHWLAPRLADFIAKCPGVTVNLSTRTRPFDFWNENFHAAIHFGLDDWPNVNSLCLMQEEVVAVAAPLIVKPSAANDMNEILKMPLLHLQTRPTAWSRWFAQKDLDIKNITGIQFDQFATMIQAAVSGLGAAIVPKYLVENELRQGKLVGLGGSATSVIGSYFLVWPERSAHHPPVIAFQNWIKSTVAENAII